eukprot:7062347-Pyramimonas_sp.AAC.2
MNISPIISLRLCFPVSRSRAGHGNAFSTLRDQCREKEGAPLNNEILGGRCAIRLCGTSAVLFLDNRPT